MTRTNNNNHLRGAALEDTLRWLHNILAANRLALVWKNELSAKIRRSGKGADRSTRAVPIKSRPDFEGMIIQARDGRTGRDLHGVHVAMDAKTTADRTYRHPADRLHQLEDLWQVQEAGGIAFLLVCWDGPDTQDRRYFLIFPTPDWENATHSARHWRSIRLDTMTPDEGCEVACENFNQLPNWLLALEQHWAEAVSS